MKVKTDTLMHVCSLKVKTDTLMHVCSLKVNEIGCGSPEDLYGAPEVEDEEDHGLVVHVLQRPQDDEEDKVSPKHLQHTANTHIIS